MHEPSPETAMRLAFYGDDFTGSTDALEVLTFAGLRCALFLQVPSAALLKALGPFDAVGVAGHSRSMSPAEMDEQLPPVLAALAELPVPLVHYKVCSTFDSHPKVGSIGHVMDLARGHLAALRALATDTPQLLTVNLGTGQGVSVLEMVNTFARVNGVPIPHRFVPRRTGDVAQCLADPQLAKQVLNWQTELSLESMCRDAWRWQVMNPQGFDTPL